MKFLTIALLAFTVVFAGCYEGRPKAVVAPRRFKIVTIANGETNVVYVTAGRVKPASRLILD